MYYRSRSNYYRSTTSLMNTAPPVSSVSFSEQEMTDPAIIQRIGKLSSNPATSDWEKTFVKSIGEYFLLKKRLTAGQMKTLVNIESKYTEEVTVKNNAFKDSFTDSMREDMKIVARIYKHIGSPYYGALVADVLSDDAFVPSEVQWTRFMTTKYAKGYLENVKSAPKFKIGDTVSPSHFDKSETWRRAIIIDNCSILPTTHSAGGKRYSILPYGASDVMTVEERSMKFVR